MSPKIIPFHGTPPTKSLYHHLSPCATPWMHLQSHHTISPYHLLLHNFFPSPPQITPLHGDSSHSGYHPQTIKLLTSSSVNHITIMDNHNMPAHPDIHLWATLSNHNMPAHPYVHLWATITNLAHWNLVNSAESLNNNSSITVNLTAGGSECGSDAPSQ